MYYTVVISTVTVDVLLHDKMIGVMLPKLPKVVCCEIAKRVRFAHSIFGLRLSNNGLLSDVWFIIHSCCYRSASAINHAPTYAGGASVM